MTTRTLSSFRLADATFAVDIAAVREVVTGPRLTAVPLAPAEVAGIINVRGELIMVVDARVRLGFQALPAGGEAHYLVIHGSEAPVALRVDQVGDVLIVAESSFAPSPETLPALVRELVLGAFRLPDSLLLLLDVARTAAVSVPSPSTERAAVPSSSSPQPRSPG